jgi:hypothetical protein
MMRSFLACLFVVDVGDIVGDCIGSRQIFLQTCRFFVLYYFELSIVSTICPPPPRPAKKEGDQKVRMKHEEA